MAAIYQWLTFFVANTTLVRKISTTTTAVSVHVVKFLLCSDIAPCSLFRIILAVVAVAVACVSVVSDVGDVSVVVVACCVRLY